MISEKVKSPATTKNIESIYPLSPMQQGMLFHSLYAPESGVYVEQMTLTLKGDINLAAFESAWQAVVDRHSILRTLFIWENRPTPLQIVLKQVDVPWTNLDWLSLSHAAQQQQLSELLHTQRAQGFAFNRAPLMGCTLIQLTDDTYQLIWNSHHILLDGWCLPVIFKEVLSFYEAQVQGEICHLPTPTPYEDYIDWLTAQDRAASTEFWRQNLHGFSAPTPLVVDRTVPQSQQPDSNHQELELKLSSDVSHKLQALAQQNHVTLSTIIQAAWGLLLSRYSGESDILFGVTVSGRPASLSGVEKMVGLFINTLPLRLQISPEQQLISWLEQIQQLMLELQQFSYAPLVEVQSLSEVVGGVSLFESILVFENYPMDSSLGNDTGSLQVGKIESREQTNFPLTVAAEFGSDLSVQISYDAVRFTEDTIERMLGHLQTIFSAIVTNPHQTLGKLPLMSAVEQQQLLLDWNNAQTDYPQDKCVHQLFEEQVAKTPDAVAVVFEQEELTYQQLNQCANQLAHYLQTLGVKPEVPVGICVERSIEMMVGLLGILKAGGAYVPLDPSYPPERLRYLLSDAGIEVLLTQNNLLSALPSHAARVVCLDTDSGVIESHSQDNLVTDISAENLAYVIYTSGSTGQPKGVTIPQRNLVAHATTIAAEYHLTAADRVLQFAALSFDVALEEILPTWLSGATVVLRPQTMLTSMVEWVEFIETHSLTVLNLPAAFWQEWILDLSTSPQDLPSCLRLVIVGSEQVQWSRVALWQQHVSDRIELYNAYGVTEATITATIYKLDSSNQQEQIGIVPIGRPIANTQVYILDPQLQPVPIGVAGELHIGGDGLARGYLNRPELTESKFIPNPFTPNRSARLYKTGDLARYLPDGNIEFLGRIDHQVKIRGFRIELGEIEAVLSSHPQIQQAVVIATTDLVGNQRLIAYVVSKEEELSTQKLWEFLQQQLPTYMVPSAFVILDTLPLTPNGKVDRKALPIPDGDIERTQEYVAPQTQIEQILTTIWQELLLRERVSIHDNFFEIGGDSILSIQVVSRAKTAGVQITPKQLFQHQTIARLSRVANTTQTVNARQGLVTGKAPLTPIQHVFWAQHHTEPHHYNQSVLLQTPPGLSSEFIATACQKLLEHHDALRLRFPAAAIEDHQQINHGLEENVPFAIVDLSTTPIPEQPQALEQIATDIQASLNLRIGPIIQLVMFNLGHQREGRLLIVIHHLAVDGVSWRILLSDLETIYQQLITQQPIQLSPKTTAFIDWAEKLERYAQSELLKSELDYWLNQPWEQATPIPLDLTSQTADNTISSTGSVTVTLSATATHQLLGSVHEAYNTQINDLLLAGLAMTLTQWTGNAAVIIDLEGHGREELFEDVDLSKTVGWFTSLFPVLLQLPSSTPPATAIKLIKEQLRTIPQRGIGYGILRYLCAGEGVKQLLQCVPSPEISFNYLGQFDQVYSETGWKFAPEATGQRRSPRQKLEHRLALDCLVVGGELQIDWTYSSQVHQRETIEDLAQSYLQNLTVLIEHCQFTEVGGFTPSDFPEADLNQTDLDLLLSKINTL
jgi:amino acid adenylation domain-containing protein/non-ribosomal peptide synthase protein (TIGR01720 family)